MRLLELLLRYLLLRQTPLLKHQLLYELQRLQGLQLLEGKLPLWVLPLRHLPLLEQHSLHE